MDWFLDGLFEAEGESLLPEEQNTAALNAQSGRKNQLLQVRPTTLATLNVDDVFKPSCVSMVMVM